MRQGKKFYARLMSPFEFETRFVKGYALQNKILCHEDVGLLWWWLLCRNGQMQRRRDGLREAVHKRSLETCHDFHDVGHLPNPRHQLQVILQGDKSVSTKLLITNTKLNGLIQNETKEGPIYRTLIPKFQVCRPTTKTLGFIGIFIGRSKNAL